MVDHASRSGGSTGGTVARHGRLQVTTAGGTVGRGIGTALAVLLAALLTFLGIVWWNLHSGVRTFDLAAGDDDRAGSGAVFEGGVNILLVGSDSREGQGEEFGEGLEEASGTLNDVNMLLHLSEDHSHASVVSIPRDTLVDTPQCQNDQGEWQDEQYGVMINSILQDGGMNCIVRTVEAMSGLDIQYAAMVKFKGVIEMSNAVGGVDVCVEQAIDDPYVGLTLDEGVHSLKGADALKFLRTRHGVGDGSDLARISNQQVFLSALFRKVKSDETFSDPGRMYAIARAATQNMTLSSNLNNVDTLVGLAGAMAKVPLEKMAFVRLPVIDAGDGGRVLPDPEQAELMWELLRNDESLLAPSTEQTAPPTAAPAQPSEERSDGDDGTPPLDEQVEPDEPDADPEPTEDGSGDGGAAPEPAPTPDFDGQTADKTTCSNPDSFF